MMVVMLITLVVNVFGPLSSDGNDDSHGGDDGDSDVIVCLDSLASTVSVMNRCVSLKVNGCC